MTTSLSLEDLKKIIGKEASKDMIDGDLIVETLDKFFADKICIIKLSDTRHEDADIIHQIVELGEGEWTHDIEGGNWQHFAFSEIERYRLAEDEDNFGYEFQWMIEGVVQSLEFHTEEEMDFMMHKLGFEGNYEPIETSKKRTSK